MRSEQPWQLRGLCRTAGRSPELWFPDNRNAPEAKRAKAFCGVCPVQESCLREALATPETYGIWGGLDEAERDVVRKRLAAA